jgi:hypothetical protein
MRKPDKPGTFRILDKGGSFLLSGVRSDGRRVKVPGLSRGEADELATKLFPASASGVSPELSPTQAIDDWGLPIRISADAIASVGAAIGIPSNGAAGKPAAVDSKANQEAKDASKKEEDEKRIRRAKQAKSLTELIGVAGAAGDVWLARRATVAVGKEPVNPNPRQVNDAADSLKETLSEWFGDREIKPWQMTILLFLGIPLAMMLQSPKRKEEKESKLAAPQIKAVP